MWVTNARPSPFLNILRLEMSAYKKQTDESFSSNMMKMSNPEYERFAKLTSPFVPKGAEAQRPFKQALGQAIFKLTDDPVELNKLVARAVEVSGVRMGRRKVDSDYGFELIKNFKSASKGTGSTDVALALFYLILKLPDSKNRPYSNCARTVSAQLFENNNSFYAQFDWKPEPISTATDENLSMSWVLFLERYAPFRDIQVELEDDSGGLSVTDLKLSEPLFENAIRLRQGFRFHVESKLPGCGIALQTCNQKTYPLRFSRNELTFENNGDTLVFPDQNGDSSERFLEEASDAKPHQFIFITVTGRIERVLREFVKNLRVGSPILNPELDELAQELATVPSLSCARRINIQFVNP